MLKTCAPFWVQWASYSVQLFRGGAMRGQRWRRGHAEVICFSDVLDCTVTCHEYCDHVYQVRSTQPDQCGTVKTRQQELTRTRKPDGGSLFVNS